MENLKKQIELIKSTSDIAMNLTEKDAIVNMLIAIRSMIDSLLIQVTGPEAPVNCIHPKERRLNLTVMGGPEQWECKDCGYEYKEGENT